jgi:hypothetical protein
MASRPGIGRDLPLSFFHFSSSFSCFTDDGYADTNVWHNTAMCLILKTEATYPSETLVLIYETTRFHIPRDRDNMFFFSLSGTAQSVSD